MKISLQKTAFPNIDLKASPEFYDMLRQNKEIVVENELTTASEHVSDNIFEVMLSIKLIEKNSRFSLEVACVGIFSISGKMDMPTVQHILNVNCCSTLYPFLREKVSYLTAACGMNPVYLDSYNFTQRYEQIKKQLAAQQK